MRILFTSAPVGSHLGWGGYLATAVALAKEKHVLLWSSGAAVAQAVADAAPQQHPLKSGATHSVPYAPILFRTVQETGWRTQMPAPLPQHADPDARRRRALDQWLDPPRVLAAVDELSPIVEDFKPDLMVGEMFMAAAALVAERCACPFVVAGWPAPSDRAPVGQDALLTHARGRLAQLLARVEVQGQNWTRFGPPALLSPHLHLSYWSPGWFAVPESEGAPRLYGPQTYGPQTVHVGGVAPTAKPADPTLPDPQDRPWVLITLGTTFNEDIAFFRMAAQAVVALGGLPVIATGAPLDTPWVQTLRAQLPASTEVRAWLDFDAILPYTATAIHHGGAGTTHALITHAIPQIVVPHAADQMRQAQGVARTGIGVALLPKNTSVAALTQLLAQLLPDGAAARRHAQRLQAEFAALGGAPVAAQHLTRVVSHTGTHIGARRV